MAPGRVPCDVCPVEGACPACHDEGEECPECGGEGEVPGYRGRLPSPCWRCCPEASAHPEEDDARAARADYLHDRQRDAAWERAS